MASRVRGALCLLLVASFIGCSFPPSSHTDSAPSLDEALQLVDRPIEGRLWGAFPYRPFTSSPTAPTAQVLQVMARVERDARGRRTTSTLSDLARITLIRDGDVDEAIALQEEAAAPEPASASILNDLSAMYLVAAQRHADMRARYCARALEAGLRSTERAPDRPEPWFNVALASACVSLRADAIDAWAHYDQTEPASGWRDEGRQRLAGQKDAEKPDDWPAMQARIIDPHIETPDEWLDDAGNHHHQATRELLEEQLLPAWGQRFLEEQQADAAILLHRAVRLAGALEQWSGDSLLIAAVDTIKHASPTTRRQLAIAHVAFGRGRARYEATDREGARTDFLDAERRLRLAGSPFLAWAELENGVTLYQLARFGDAAALFDRVVGFARSRRFVSLHGRALWLRGLALTQLGQPEDAMEAYSGAITQFERAGEREAVASTASAAANALRLSGEHSSGWSFLTAALADLRSVTHARRRHTVLLNGSLFAADDQLPRAALQFQQASVAAAFERGTTNTIIEGLVRRARLYMELRQLDAAERDINLAQQLVTNVSSPSTRRYTAAWVDRMLGELQARRRDPHSIDAFQRARDYFETTEPFEVPGLQLAIGRAHLAAGNQAEAERSWLRGLDVLEARARLLSDDRFRLAAVSDGWELVRELIRLYVSTRHTPDRAFAVAERARAVLAFGAQHPLGASSSLLTEVRQRTPSATAVLAYLVLDDRVSIWLCTPGGAFSFEHPIARSVLRQQVARVRRAIEGTAHAADATDRTLFDLLLGDALARVPRQSTLIIVPDDVLTTVPFAAMVDPRTGAPLVDSYQLALMPSIAHVLASGAPARGAAAPAPLLVGYDRAPGQPMLPAVAQEIDEIGRIYPHADVLTGANATFSHLRATLRQHDVLHFAGHARANEWFPFRTQLFFAPDAEHPSGAVSAEALTTAGISHVRLAVLAACETAGGPVWQGVGTISVARLLLDAGVPSVVGALWRVDDDASRALLVQFHREYAKGVDPVAALHAAQLALRQSSDPRLRSPRTWSSFIVISGFPQH